MPSSYLCDMRAVEALPVLKGELMDYLNTGLQRHVVRNIARFGKAEAVPALIGSLEYGGDPKFRMDVIEVLVQLGDRSAVPALIQAMERWGDRTAPGALLSLGGREAEDALIRQVDPSRSDQAVSRAAQLLGGGGITRAMPYLRRAVEEARSMYAVADAAWALGQLGDAITGTRHGGMAAPRGR